jgi:hypothetical protein
MPDAVRTVLEDPVLGVSPEEAPTDEERIAALRTSMDFYLGEEFDCAEHGSEAKQLAAAGDLEAQCAFVVKVWGTLTVSPAHAGARVDLPESETLEPRTTGERRHR